MVAAPGFEHTFSIEALTEGLEWAAQEGMLLGLL